MTFDSTPENVFTLLAIAHCSKFTASLKAGILELVRFNIFPAIWDFADFSRNNVEKIMSYKETRRFKVDDIRLILLSKSAAEPGAKFKLDKAFCTPVSFPLLALMRKLSKAETAVRRCSEDQSRLYKSLNYHLLDEQEVVQLPAELVEKLVRQVRKTFPQRFPDVFRDTTTREILNYCINNRDCCLYLARSVSLDSRDLRGRTALEMAASSNAEEAAEQLLSCADGRDEQLLQAALHCAAEAKSKAVVELLLRHGASVNAADPESGSTALHAAARDRFCETPFPAKSFRTNFDLT
jgi:hypothetical protein